ncbi:META domain-containing protein [Novosphingobium soli]|uniref:META domain-containing protein n=1 Tax=Novosphingobium soli TaxID=574956 RepID=A0ABV6CQ40_9SPHN
MKSRLHLRQMSGSVAVLLAIAGCASMNETASRESTLIGPTWQLVSIRKGEQTTNLTPQQSARYTIEFVVHDDARLQLGCNSGTAGWSASLMRHVLRIGEIRSTRMACPDAEIESLLRTGLPGGNTYGFSSDERTLMVRSKVATFSFRNAAD